MQRLVCSDSRIEPGADAWSDQHVILVIASPYCPAPLAFTKPELMHLVPTLLILQCSVLAFHNYICFWPASFYRESVRLVYFQDLQYCGGCAEQFRLNASHFRRFRSSVACSVRWSEYFLLQLSCNFHRHSSKSQSCHFWFLDFSEVILQLT